MVAVGPKASLARAPQKNSSKATAPAIDVQMLQWLRAQQIASLSDSASVEVEVSATPQLTVLVPWVKFGNVKLDYSRAHRINRRQLQNGAIAEVLVYSAAVKDVVVQSNKVNYISPRTGRAQERSVYNIDLHYNRPPNTSFVVDREELPRDHDDERVIRIGVDPVFACKISEPATPVDS